MPPHLHRTTATTIIMNVRAIRPFLLLLFLLTFIHQRPITFRIGGNICSHSIFITALPVSMLKSFYGLHPLNTLLRNSHQQRQIEQPSLVVLTEDKNTRRNDLQRRHVSTTITRQDELLEEAQPFRLRSHQFGTLKLCPPGKEECKNTGKRPNYWQAADPSLRPSN